MYDTVISDILQEQRRNQQDSVLEKSKLVELAYEMGWNWANIFQTETIIRYRKWIEPSHRVCL